MKFSLKDSIINILLILLCLITLFVCIYLYNNKEIVTENITLVKDMTDSVGRIKTDKTETISKVDRPNEVLEENGMKRNEDGSLTLIVPTPEGKKEVEEVIVPEPKPEVKNKSNGTVGEVKVKSQIVGETEPLNIYPIGTVVEEIKKESTTPEYEVVKHPEYINVLMSARKERNKGRINLSTSFSVLDYRGNYVSLEEITKNASVIILFDNLDDKTLNMLKSIESIYSEYKDRVNIVLLQSTYDMTTGYSKVKNKLNENGITLNIPMYFDKEMMFYGQTGINSSMSCVLMNSDCYVVKSMKSDISVSELSKDIDKLIEEEGRIKKENDVIKSTGVYEPIVEEE